MDWNLNCVGLLHHLFCHSLRRQRFLKLYICLQETLRQHLGHQRYLNLTRSLGTLHVISRIFLHQKCCTTKIGPHFIRSRDKWRSARFGIHIQWWFVYPDTFVPCRYFRINEFSGLLNRPLVRTWKSVPTLFVRTKEISGLSEPGLTNHHCIYILDSKNTKKKHQIIAGQSRVPPSLYRFFSGNYFHKLSKVFRSAAKQPTQ